MENLPYPMSAPPVVNYKAIKEKNVPRFQLDFLFFFSSSLPGLYAFVC